MNTRKLFIKINVKIWISYTTHTLPLTFSLSFYRIVQIYMKRPLLNQEVAYDYVSFFIWSFIFPEANNHLILCFAQFSTYLLQFFFPSALTCLLNAYPHLSKHLIPLVIHWSLFLLESPVVETSIFFSNLGCSFGIFLLRSGWNARDIFLLWSG